MFQRCHFSLHASHLLLRDDCKLSGAVLTNILSIQHQKTQCRPVVIHQKMTSPNILKGNSVWVRERWLRALFSWKRHDKGLIIWYVIEI